MSDGAIKDDKSEPIDLTPLCLLFGQGHQHVLERLAALPATPAPPPRGKGKTAVRLSAAACLEEALFQPWHRSDSTDRDYKTGTQHGRGEAGTYNHAGLYPSRP